MEDIRFYFDLGWQHIISWDALDHILFIATLAAIYILKDWKKVLILITAFTVGHSLTLALSSYDIIRFSDKWVEFLIPCTIIFTALFNIFLKDFSRESLRINYFFALLFGLIHGMGFANSIRFMLARDQKIALPLLSFNIGLEVGQMMIVTIILVISYLVISILKLSRKLWVLSLSVIAFAVALKMAIERWPG
ncbi:MAG TPA: HupE/UreJ family protein [Chitinophagaceae bacterium]|nr:HupE/UreJ family protein [Chitinophagaceae bacterium]